MIRRSGHRRGGEHRKVWVLRGHWRRPISDGSDRLSKRAKRRRSPTLRPGSVRFDDDGQVESCAIDAAFAQGAHLGRNSHFAASHIWPIQARPRNVASSWHTHSPGWSASRCRPSECRPMSWLASRHDSASTRVRLRADHERRGRGRRSRVGALGWPAGPTDSDVVDLRHRPGQGNDVRSVPDELHRGRTIQDEFVPRGVGHG